MQYRSKRNIRILGSFAAVSVMALLAAVAAYKTHSESDSDLFCKTYPQVIGTKLDGCEVCHVRIQALPPGQKSGQTVLLSTCNSCHVLTDYGRKQGDTLTPYGRDYLKNGRNAGALQCLGRIRRSEPDHHGLAQRGRCAARRADHTGIGRARRRR